MRYMKDVMLSTAYWHKISFCFNSTSAQLLAMNPNSKIKFKKIED